MIDGFVEGDFEELSKLEKEKRCEKTESDELE
jgi:hypothetical protein